MLLFLSGCGENEQENVAEVISSNIENETVIANVDGTEEDNLEVVADNKEETKEEEIVNENANDAEKEQETSYEKSTLN